MYIDEPLSHDLADGDFTSPSIQLSASAAIAELHSADVTGTVSAKLQMSLNDSEFTDIPESEEGIDEGQQVMGWGLGPLMLPSGIYIRAVVAAADATGIITNFKLFSNE